MSEKFSTTILGCSAATPTSLRHTTSQFVRYRSKNFLLDCAEGSQMQMRRGKMPVMKIDHIFISHLHGDHYLGLMGLLFSYHLMGRDKRLFITSPPGLKEVIDLQFQTSGHQPSYPITYQVIENGEQRVYEDRNIAVDTIEMVHRLPCYGFLFREKTGSRNINKEAIYKYQIPINKMNDIKKGSDFVDAVGNIIPNRKITFDPPVPRSYAFCSDTGYTESYVEQIKGVDLLYHEATFLQDKTDKAREKMHCTTIDAATIARKAQVKQLLLGHYSARYKDLREFGMEAKSVFPNTLIGAEFLEVDVRPDV